MKLARLAPALAFLAALALPAAAAPSREVHQTLPLDARGTLHLKTYKGSITVTTGTAAEVRVDARVEADPEDSNPARSVEETKVVIDGRGAAVRIESDYSALERHQHWFSFNDDVRLPFVHYTISMPRTARLEIDDYKSDVKVSGLAAALDLETYKGDVLVHDLEGTARFETYKGEMRVELARLAGDVSFSTYKGRCELTLPKDSRFTVDADTGRRGSFESDFSVTSGASSRHGHRRDDDERDVHGDVNGGGPRVHFDTYKGALVLRAR